MVAGACQLVVAIDGPAGSGKSTVGAEVAKRLGALYFDTGVVYRVLALLALERGIAPDDADRLAQLAQNLSIRVGPPSVQDGRLYDVWLDGRDVTWAIRTPEIDRLASLVSAHPPVRRALLRLQRELARNGRVVIAGRDIGTVVMPEAPVKIWLHASLEERARRRQRDLARRGIVRSPEEIVAELADRDRRDATRAIAPMRPAEDAVIIDTDDRTIEEVVETVLAVVRERCECANHGSDSAGVAPLAAP
ncbi:MAG: (d)CMP kinase [Thermomicrobium sp.]|nr:(d)CMP kinase [Thermomicrobium sp.]MBO9351216.1 (d)CMP kinase [Thermomicrobium sp.]